MSHFKEFGGMVFKFIKKMFNNFIINFDFKKFCEEIKRIINLDSSSTKELLFHVFDVN